MDRGNARPRVVSAAPATGVIRPPARGEFAVAAAIVGLAVLAGLSIGDPSPLWYLPLAIIAGATVLYAGARWPFAGLQVILGSSILLVVVRASGLRSVNLLDVLLPPVLLVSVFGRARRDARAHVESGSAHERLYAAERGFTRAVLVFFAAAVLSLVSLAREAGVGAALDSSLLLIRAAQGLLLYPLCIWWLRTPARIAGAWNAMFVAGIALGITNVVGATLWGVPRGGSTLFLNNPDAPFSSPNEGGSSTLIVLAVLIMRQIMRPDWKNFALAALMVVVLALTQSRSALLAWVTFALFTLRWVRPSRLLAGALSLAAIAATLPQAFWGRMARSLVVERGSFEAYSFFQRVYGWRTAWLVFLDHPWTGVGYLGYRFVSHRYNELRIVLTTVENYYYETLVSMGIIGVVLLAIVIVRWFQLGRAVARAAPRGTLAHHMARFHTPLLLGLLIANLTGDNFAGMASIAQLAMWTAILVRSGHAAVTEGTQA